MNAEEEGREKQVKKPYESPKLVMHGTVEKITELISGSITDLMGGSQIK